MEVPADFLDTISEEKNENKQTTGQQIAKKYPFNRTTTPNSLREHLKETLTKNLGGNFFVVPVKNDFKNSEFQFLHTYPFLFSHNSPIPIIIFQKAIQENSVKRKY